MGSAVSTAMSLRRSLISLPVKRQCDSTNEFSCAFNAALVEIEEYMHCPSNWLDAGGTFAELDRQLVIQPDPGTQYPGRANVLWRVFHFQGLSAGLSSLSDDIATVAESAELIVTALDEMANVWAVFEQDGSVVAVIVVEVKGVGRVKPKVGVSIYSVTDKMAPGSATTVDEALDLTSSESKKDRRLLMEELKALLGDEPDLRRWAHMRVLSHASVNDDDIEWRIQLASQGWTIDPADVHDATTYTEDEDGVRYSGRNASKKTLQAAYAALTQSDVVQAKRPWQCSARDEASALGDRVTPLFCAHACRAVPPVRLPAREIPFCDKQGEQTASDNQADKLLVFSSKLGNVAILESSSMHSGQKALRIAAGVEPLLFACVAAVQGRCTDAANKHKAGEVGDALWLQ